MARRDLERRERRALLIPEGFAHGLQTLADDVDMLYCHSSAYAADAEGGVHPREPRAAIAWPLPIAALSARDDAQPCARCRLRRHRRMKCRHCAAALERVCLDLGSAPPSNAYLTDAMLRAPELWYPLRLLVCERCWLVQTEDHAGREALFAPTTPTSARSRPRGWRTPRPTSRR